jgi:hypothetical protein
MTRHGGCRGSIPWRVLAFWPAGGSTASSRRTDGHDSGSNGSRGSQDVGSWPCAIPSASGPAAPGVTRAVDAKPPDRSRGRSSAAVGVRTSQSWGGEGGSLFQVPAFEVAAAGGGLYWDSWVPQPSAAQVRALPKLRASGSEFGRDASPAAGLPCLGCPLARASCTRPHHVPQGGGDRPVVGWAVTRHAGGSRAAIGQIARNGRTPCAEMVRPGRGTGAPAGAD